MCKKTGTFLQHCKLTILKLLKKFLIFKKHTRTQKSRDIFFHDHNTITLTKATLILPITWSIIKFCFWKNAFKKKFHFFESESIQVIVMSLKLLLISNSLPSTPPWFFFLAIDSLKKLGQLFRYHPTIWTCLFASLKWWWPFTYSSIIPAAPPLPNCHTLSLWINLIRTFHINGISFLCCFFHLA